MRRVLFIWISLLLSLTACLAAPSTEGREFWLTFMRNIRQGELSLFVSARENATVTVENPNTHWTTSFAVSPGKTATCTIPRAQGYMSSNGKVESKGIHVTSTTDISLFASNYADYTYDATLVLPVTALGNNYIIQTWEDNEETAEMAIVATTPTTVTITPHARTKDDHVKNVSYDVHLQTGEVLQVQKADEYNNFSGTYIRSDKPIAVFAGHACAKVPESNDWCDHLVEQQRPTAYWGKQFALVKTIGQQGNRIMLTARDNNTIVSLNGTQVATLNALESYAFRLTENSAYLESSEPVACFLYPEGARANDLYGDPSSVTINPFEQRIRDITFATFHTQQSASNFVNIVTTYMGAQSMTLDGKSVSAAFEPLAGTTGMRFAQLPISQGTHTLHTSEDGFVGYVYGLGYCESYAYSLGSANYSFYPEEHNGTPLDYLYREIKHTDAQCYRKPVTFTALTNIDYTSIEWDFGDGATASGLTATHTYAAPGAYTVTLTVHTDKYQTSTTETVLLSDMYRDTIHAEICEGEQYDIEGQTFTYSGVYTLKQSATETCDSLVVLDLNVHPKYFLSETASFPKGSSYTWHERRFRQPGVYRDSLLSVYGCDSVYELHLTQTDEEEEMYDTICYQPTYPFHGYNFPLPSVAGYEDRTYINYTLCYADKNKCKTYRIHLAIVPREGGEYTVYDTISAGQTYTWLGNSYMHEGIYRKVIGDNACKEIYTLNLTVLPFQVEVTDTVMCHEDSIVWRGRTYRTAGTYADTVASQTGIEKIYRLNLTDRRSFYEMSVSDVTDYEFHSRLLSVSGTYRDTLTNAAGCDSVVTLYLDIAAPYPTLTALEVEDGCADDGVLELELFYMGVVDRVGLAFDEKAHAAGFTDTVLPMPANGIVTLPFRARAGHFTGSAALIYRDSTTAQRPFAFTLLYPSSVLEQAWNDVIAVLTYDYNGGYHFEAFQWYENGVPIQGENRSYLYRPLLMGAEYSALLTETDGTQMMTCPLIAQPQTDLTLYPTLLTPGQALYCRVSEPAEMNLYDACGNRLMHRTLPAGTNTLTAPMAEGIYIVRIQPTAAQNGRQYKLLIR